MSIATGGVPQAQPWRRVRLTTIKKAAQRTHEATAAAEGSAAARVRASARIALHHLKAACSATRQEKARCSQQRSERMLN